jgi:AcrR family transcriptional regulator
LAANIEGRIKRLAIATFVDAGLAGLSVDQICTHAEVSRSAFHRRWRDAYDALLEALDDRMRLPALPDTGCVLADLAAYAEAYLDLFRDPVFTAFVFRLMAVARWNPELAQRLQRGFAARRAVNSILIERAVERGELATDCDPDVILNAVLALVLSWAGTGKAPPREEISCAIERLISAGSIH